jgi:ribosomal protein S18 acetylase RimI-like enzyme
MFPYKFIKDYKHNDIYRASFNELAKNTFQIDFEPWYKLGFWNDRYICYSFLDGEKIIANVSVSKMEMMIEGQLKKAIQIGTVMTHPNYRKQGLAGHLMNKVIAEYEHENEIFLLFSEEDVSVGFYKKYGFKQLQESKFTVAVQPTTKNSQPQKLSIEANKQMILDYYTKKKSSRSFDIEKGEHILGFYGVYVFGNALYYVEDLDVVVVYTTSEEKLHLYGVFSDHEVLFNELINYIATEKTTEVVFHFTPNFEDINATFTPIITTDDIFQVRTSTVKLPIHFKFPVIAHA